MTRPTVTLIPAVTKVIEPERVQLNISRDDAEKLLTLTGQTSGMLSLYQALRVSLHGEGAMPSSYKYYMKDGVVIHLEDRTDSDW
jgi:hypothetical protein